MLHHSRIKAYRRNGAKAERPKKERENGGRGEGEIG
jgi:hypothetical protein